MITLDAVVQEGNTLLHEEIVAKKREHSAEQRREMEAVRQRDSAEGYPFLVGGHPSFKTRFHLQPQIDGMMI